MSELQRLKDRAKFYKAGSIIPFRVLAMRPRKYQHTLTFGSDSWVLPGARGYVVFSPHREGFPSVAVMITRRIKRGATVTGSIWHGPHNISQFVGEWKTTPEKFIHSIVEALKP